MRWLVRNRRENADENGEPTWPALWEGLYAANQSFSFAASARNLVAGGLHLFAGRTLHATERQRHHGADLPDESLDRLITAAGPVVAAKILVYPLRRQPALQRRFDQHPMRFAQAGQTRANPGGRFMAGFVPFPTG